MRAGRLQRTILVQRSVTTLNAYGNPTEVWSTLVTLRAEVRHRAAVEFMRAHGASSETTIILRSRWADGITLADRVLFGGDPYRLAEIREIGRRQGMELRCEKVGP